MSAEAPWPIIEVAVEPRSRGDQEKLYAALRELAAGDPSFAFTIDHESGQVIMLGQSVDHLEQKAGDLVDERGLGMNFGAPQVAYRETLGRRAESDATYKAIHGPKGSFARVKLVFEPGEPGSGYQFENQIAGGSVPEEYIPGVIMGLESARANGLLAGFPVIDFKATLVDGAFHDVDSSVHAFETAARAAFRELREKGEPKLLEPIMRVEVSTPGEYVGDVVGDLNSRRGQVRGVEQRGDTRVITAFVPLANLFGYDGNLRGMCQGRADFTMVYDHYATVDLTPNPDPDLFPPAAAMRA